MKNEFQRIVERYLDDYWTDELNSSMREHLADRITAILLDEFDKDGQRHRWTALDDLGNPRCSWCGAMGGANQGTGKDLLIRPGHPQYGIFCTCTEPLAKQP